MDKTPSFPRALIVSEQCPNYAGGVEQVCRHIVRTLGKAGFQTIYLPVASTLPQGFNTGFALSKFRTVAEVICAKRESARLGPFDLVVTNGSMGWGVGRSVPSVHYYHGTYAGQAEKIRQDISRMGYLKLKYVDSYLFERFAGKGSVCAANSLRTASEVSRYFGHTCRVLWCPIDTAQFNPGPRDPAIYAWINRSPDQPLGLVVAPNRPTKGSKAAASVMTRLKNVNWLVLTDNTSMSEAPNILPRRPVSHHQMPRVLRSVDFVLSLSSYESFGLVIAEALACGTPVVGGPSGVGDLLSMSTEFEDYFVSDPLDEERIVAAILTIMEDRERATTAASAARSVILRTLRHDLWEQRFLSLVEEALSAR